MNSDRLDHARHNEEVCKYLNEAPYNDWVVTTAFYSAIHYVRHAIFPLTETEDGEEYTYRNFDEYYNDVRYKIDRGKHAELSELVKRHIVHVCGEYKWLLKTCHTARYNDYNVSDSLRRRALKCMDEIKKASVGLAARKRMDDED